MNNKNKDGKNDGRVYRPLSSSKQKWPEKVLFCFRKSEPPELLSDTDLLKAYGLTYRVSEEGKPLDDAAVYTAYSMYEAKKFIKKFSQYEEAAIALFEKDGSFHTYTFNPEQRVMFILKFKSYMIEHPDDDRTLYFLEHFFKEN